LKVVLDSGLFLSMLALQPPNHPANITRSGHFDDESKVLGSHPLECSPGTFSARLPSRKTLTRTIKHHETNRSR
jgi:hypothetical protein